MRRATSYYCGLVFALGGLISPVNAAEEKTGDLAEAAQNPIASMISLPFQNNTYFDIGPDNDTANALLIQPVYPMSLSKDWNVITRAIARCGADLHIFMYLNFGLQQKTRTINLGLA